jgi:uncharacterized delta-60 repeat protein
MGTVRCMRSRNLIVAALALVAVVVFAATAIAADGELDPSFSGDGRTTSDPTLLEENVADAMVDSQGRIVVVGYGEPGLSGPGRAYVARFTAGGELDPSFNGDGWDIILWSGGSPSVNESARSVALDPLGRILVGGAVSGGTGFDFAVARYTDEGLLDSSFSGDGRNTVGLQGGGSDIAYGVDADQQSRVVLAGTASGVSNMAVARFKENGDLDEGFGINSGSTIVGFVGYDGSEGTAVEVDGAGRIVVAGYAYLGSGQSDSALARLDQTGEFDSGFGSAGRVVIDFGVRPNESLRDLALDGSGGIVIIGKAGATGATVANLGRLLDNGSPDPGFDSDGKAVTALAEGLTANRVAIDPAGRIVLAAALDNGADVDAGLLRYLSSGAIDPTFGSGGIVREDFLAANARGEGLGIDPDGRYLLAGTALASGGARTIGLARFSTSYPQPPAPSASDLPTPPPPPRCAGIVATKVGTAKRNVIRGTNKRDVIVSLGGDDLIKGRGGNDLICAGAGKDVVKAGAGNDRVFGGSGRDRLLGEGGRDRLLGEAGKDALRGGPGRDVER